MTISNNGYTCEEMYETPCVYELRAVRMGTANYECKNCGALRFAEWPDHEAMYGITGETK